MIDKLDLPKKLRSFVNKHNIKDVPSITHDFVFPCLRSNANENMLFTAMGSITGDARFSGNPVVKLLLLNYAGSRWSSLSKYNATVSTNLYSFFPPTLSGIIESYVDSVAEMIEPDIEKEETIESNHDEGLSNTKRSCSLM